MKTLHRSFTAMILLIACLAGGVGNATSRTAPFDQATQCGVNKGNMANGTYCVSDPSPTLALGVPFLAARAGILSVGGQQSILGSPIPYVTLASVSNYSVSAGAFSSQAVIKPLAIANTTFSLCLQVQQSISGGAFTAVGSIDCISGEDLYFRPLVSSGTSASGAILKATVTLSLPTNNGLPGSAAGEASIQVESIG